MFVRTPRLTLRPGWAEDAIELHEAFADERVIRNLGRAPWPYTLADAQEFLSRPAPPAAASLLVYAHDEGHVRLVGGVGFGPYEDRPFELGYWIRPDSWGKGYATEAARGVVEAARAIGVPKLTAGHFIDNPASGRVLAKLGFRPTRTERRYSLGRGETATSVALALSLRDDSHCDDDQPRMAA